MKPPGRPSAALAAAIRRAESGAPVLQSTVVRLRLSGHELKSDF